MSLINIVAIADPEKIIFYGRTSQHHVSFFKPVQAMLAAHQIQVELAVSEQPETIASIGAAILGFKMKYPNLRYAHPV